MIALLWKEWKQNRLIFALGLLVPVLFCMLYATHPRHLYIKAPDVPGTLYVIGLLYALLVGSVLISQEIGSGAISELFARPVNPWQVWLSKFLFGVITTAAVVLFAVILGLIVASRIGEMAVSNMWSLAIGKTPLAIILLLPPAVLAVALFASNMTDQPILAILGAVFVAAAFTAYWFRWAFLMAVAGGSGEIVRRFIAPLGVSTSLVLSLALSSWIHAKGQLHTGLRAPRWRLAGVSIVCLTLICVISLLWGSSDLLHLGPYEDFRVSVFRVSPNAKKVAIRANARRTPLVATLWVLDLESGERLLPDHYLDAPAHLYYPDWGAAWSPDNTRFAMWVEPSYPGVVGLRFASDSQRLQVLDLEEQTVRTLKGFRPEGGWPHPLLAWARSGDLLYYYVREDGIEHLSLDGTVVKRVPIEIQRPVSNVHPRRVVGTDPLLFLCDCGMSYPLEHSDDRTVYALLNPITGETKVIDLGSEAEVTFLDISLDGRYMLHARYDRPLRLEEKASPRKHPPPPSRLFLRDVSTGLAQPLLEEKAWLHIVTFHWRIPFFSPDGTRFVVQERHTREGADARVEVYIVDIAQNSLARLIEIDERTEWVGHLRWSPDGTRIAITVGVGEGERGRPPARTDLHVITLKKDGATKTVAATAEMGTMGAFAWLSDDELLYASGNAVYRVKADGTGRRKVFPP